MQEAIEVLAYTRQIEECPECAKGKKLFGENAEFYGCESCGGSGTKEFVSMVVRRFVKCKKFQSELVDNIEFEREEKPFVACDCGDVVACSYCNGEGRKEQTFKVNEKCGNSKEFQQSKAKLSLYKFALQTGKCTDCRLMSLDCYNVPTKVCHFEPRIISGVVREDGIPFKVWGNLRESEIKKGEGVLLRNGTSFEIFKKVPEALNGDASNLSTTLPYGEYILLPKVEVVK